MTITLVNGDESDAQLGQIQYTLRTQPDTLVSGSLEPVQHRKTIEPGDCDQARFALRAAAAGELVLTGSASCEVHAMDYRAYLIG